MPGINDDPQQVAEIVRLATEAGATHIGGIALHLRAGVREVFFDWLRAHRPELVEQYEELYKRGAYAPTEERKRLAKLVRTAEWKPSSGLGLRRGTTRRRGEPEAGAGDKRPAQRPARKASPQQTLF
jgi:DNA repair photolyase